MSGGDRFAVALVREQFDEPGFVLDFLVQDSRRHVVGARVFAEGHVADFTPAADGAALRLQQQRKNVHDCRWIGQLCGFTSCLIVERRQIVRQFAAKFINTGNDELPVGAIFEPRIFADLFVVLVSGQMHAQNCVVVVGAGELSCRIGNEHLDQLFNIHAARAYDLNANAGSHVALFDDSAFCHIFPPARRLRAARAIGLIYRCYICYRQNTSVPHVETRQVASLL